MTDGWKDSQRENSIPTYKLCIKILEISPELSQIFFLGPKQDKTI